MSRSAFFQSSGTQQFADTVYNLTRIPRSVIMAQMAIETYYGTSQPWRVCKNPAGIKQYTPSACIANDGGWYRSYASYTQSAVAYAQFYLDNSNYAQVLSVARNGGSPDQVARALGQSPWASSHYRANGYDGGLLVEVISQNNLQQYDSPVAATGTSTTPPVVASIESHPLLYALGGTLLGVGAWFTYRYFKQQNR